MRTDILEADVTSLAKYRPKSSPVMTILSLGMTGRSDHLVVHNAGTYVIGSFASEGRCSLYPYAQCHYIWNDASDHHGANASIVRFFIFRRFCNERNWPRHRCEFRYTVRVCR